MALLSIFLSHPVCVVGIECSHPAADALLDATSFAATSAAATGSAAATSACASSAAACSTAAFSNAALNTAAFSAAVSFAGVSGESSYENSMAKSSPPPMGVHTRCVP
jgi:hypothetical protein